MDKYVVSLYKHQLYWNNIRWKSVQEQGKRMLELTNIGWLLEEANASDEAGDAWNMANRCSVLSVVARVKFSTKSYSCV